MLKDNKITITRNFQMATHCVFKLYDTRKQNHILSVTVMVSSIICPSLHANLKPPLNAFYDLVQERIQTLATRRQMISTKSLLL